jgi:hypothetical protein
LPPTECRDVTGCSDCPTGSVCAALIARIPSAACVVPAAGCEKGSYCECLGACGGGVLVCSEHDEGVSCDCQVC